MFNHCDMETINMYACMKVLLGGNIMNITLSFSYTHQTLRKYRKHLKMGFLFFFLNAWKLNEIKIFWILVFPIIS